MDVSRSGRRSSAIPPVVRSRQALAAEGVDLAPPGAVKPAALPIAPEGTTYTMAQEIEWLDSDHFAVGRWDGSMSVFTWTESTTQGPVITVAAADPLGEGVQMITALGPNALATSSGDADIAVWTAQDSSWRSLSPQLYPFDGSLGAANSGAVITSPGGPFLLVGHAGGYLTVWRLTGAAIEQVREYDLRNPEPVNPWGLHNIRGVQVFVGRFAVTGSEDGFISVIDIPGDEVSWQVVYNENAQRGINSVALRMNGDLLIANCAVGPADSNLWYFHLDSNVQPIRQAETNLRVNPLAAQVFNFCTIWGVAGGESCFFASTEEGALWMGEAIGGELTVAGYMSVTSPLGSALGYAGAGRLALVSHDVYEFNTGG